MKDFHVVGKKMTKNARKVAIYIVRFFMDQTLLIKSVKLFQIINLKRESRTILFPDWNYFPNAIQILEEFRSQLFFHNAKKFQLMISNKISHFTDKW